MNQPRHFCPSALAVCALSIAFNAARATETETIASIWKPIDIQFTYLSMTSFYSCNALEWKLALLLKAIGAHDKTQVSTIGCLSTGPAQNPVVRITGAVPVPATAENRNAMTKDASRQELLKRLGVKPDFDADDFPALRKNLDLSRVRSAGLQPGDCELMEQLARDVFPKLGTTTVHDTPNCFPGQVPISTPPLRVTILVKVPTADQPTRQEERN